MPQHMHPVTLKASSLMPQLVLEVKLTGQRALARRMRVATFLIKTAAWVIGCGVHVEAELK
jgi:hypothetical protein